MTLMRILLLIALTLSTVAAQNVKPAKLAGEDWVQIFNGKNLTGWVEVGKEKWTVEDGEIKGEAASKAYGYLMSDKDYKDFHLSLKFKCVGDGNSGLFYHVAFKPGTPDVSRGLQFEIDCRIGQHTGGIYGDGRNWIVWPSPENELTVRKSDWNEYTMKVEGNRYVSRLNGVVMVDFTDPNPKSFDGPIALQLHSGGEGNMRFKDIWIRDLSKR